MRARRTALTLFLWSSAAFADGIEGPALTAWYPRYNLDDPGLAVHGSGCLNREENMPPGREAPCGKPLLSELGPGRYAITTENLAPFPELADDSGHLVFVQTVGSNAQCFEEATTATGHALESVLRCVDPSTGDDVDTDFSWSYRADSSEFPQEGGYLPNFAYARATRSGELVPAESFNPLNLHGEDVLVERTAEGAYRVTFRDLNPLDGSLEPSMEPYSVVVQKTCLDDGEGGELSDGCFRAVCAVESWVPGSFIEYDTTVEVACTDATGAPRDTGFRVFFGDEGFTSQGGFDGGYRFGWANWTLAPSDDGCFTQPELAGNSQHETPPSYFPGFPVEACRAEQGLYEVNFFSDYVAPYSVDGIAPVVTSHTPADAYCNVKQILCPAGHGICGLPGSPDNTRVSVACFDRSGAPADARWSLNLTY